MIRRRNRRAVGARGFQFELFPRGLGDHRKPAVEGLQICQIHFLDIAADAAFGEAQRHPRLEAFDDSGLRFGVLGQVEVQPVGKGIHELLQPRGTGGVLLLQLHRVDEELHAQILVNERLALRLRQTPHGVEVVGFDAIEIVLGLGVLHSEDRVGVGLAVDMRDAPVVADDGDVPGLLFPARRLRIFGRLECETGRHRRQRENQLLQFVLHA